MRGSRGASTCRMMICMFRVACSAGTLPCAGRQTQDFEVGIEQTKRDGEGAVHARVANQNKPGCHDVNSLSPR